MLHIRRITTPANLVSPWRSRNILYGQYRAKDDRGEHNEQDIH